MGPKNAFLFKVFWCVFFAALPVFAETTKEDIRYYRLQGFGREISVLRENDAKWLLSIYQAAIKRLNQDLSLEKREGLPQYLSPQKEVSKKDLIKALTFMVSRLERGLSHPAEARRAFMEAAEVHQALELNFKPPLPSKKYLEIEAAKILIDSTLRANPFMKGKQPAINLLNPNDAGSDPYPTTFWRGHKRVSELNLRIGFNREATLSQELSKDPEPCRFLEVKKGYGTHPGFRMKCSGKTIKVKFSELRSEPFAARVLWALGYHLDPVDYIGSVRVTYDPEFFTKVNDRKEMALDLKVHGVIQAKRIVLTQKVDPFSLLTSARLKNGKEIGVEELKSRLLLRRDADLLKLKDTDLNPEFAKSISELRTVEVQLQEKKEDEERIGPWQWEDFNHPWLRETRGLLAIAAWLGWYDCRFDNNRVMLLDNGTRIEHRLSDVGGVLGRSSGHFSNEYEQPDRMAEEVTRRGPLGGVQFINFRTLEPNQAFEDATPEDVKWGVRMIKKIQPRQIIDAAIGSGFSEKEAHVILDKLNRRASKMGSDLDI